MAKAQKQKSGQTLFEKALAVITPVEVLVLNLEEMLGDMQYQVPRTKDPRKLRALLRSVHFYNSVKHHLSKIKNKEVQNG